MGWDVIGMLLWVMSTSRDPVRARARISHWALAARTMPEADRRKVFEARLPVGDWPAKMLEVTAVDARTGEFVVFDSAVDAGLVDAVGAQLRGARSLAAGHHRGPPFHRRWRALGSQRRPGGPIRAGGYLGAGGPGHRPMTSPRRQAAALAAAGARVVLVRPDRAAVHAIGHNVLDLSRRAAAATAGRAQAAAEAGAVRAVWQADGGPVAS